MIPAIKQEMAGVKHDESYSISHMKTSTYWFTIKDLHRLVFGQATPTTGKATDNFLEVYPRR
jgi:hypothetical protein